MPNPEATLLIFRDLSLTRKDEVISFIKRNLEPSPSYHKFMNVLPDTLRAWPQAQVVVLGEDGDSYGAAPPSGESWKQLYIDEACDDIPDTVWAWAYFLSWVPYDAFVSMQQISRANIYLSYPFVPSRSLMEAMSAGAAIVASDTAPVCEVIRDREIGVLGSGPINFVEAFKPV